MKRTSMMMAALTLTVASSLGFTPDNHDLCEGFVPKNEMKIPVGWSTKGAGLTEAQFNEVIDRLELLFTDDVAQAGGTLRVNRKWTDPTVNASAQQIGSSWVINMYGGLARHPEITIEGFALVACHELGHHMGGAPKIRGWFGNDWATNEGGSDYFATLKCLRQFFADDDNESIISDVDFEPIAVSQCESQFTTRQDQLLCLRNAMAGASVAGLFMDLRKETTRPRFDTPDQRVVSRTNDAHPATQCRMDTYFAGAICSVDASVPVSNTDYREGSCVQGADSTGWRPTCWFKPD